MSETSTTAMLVDTGEAFGTSNVVATTVPRSQIEDALALDPPAELVLDVVRRSEKTDFERRTVSVAWRREDLESVLGHSEAAAITFTFDADELERAIAGSDVEGHGLRETAAVLTVAAAAAAAGASGAFGAVHDEASLAERGIVVEASTSTHTEAGLTERGIGIQTVSSTHDEMTSTARGIEAGTPPAVHDEATLAARGIEPGTPPAAHDEATLAARGIEPEAVPPIQDSATRVIHDESTLADRGIEPGTLPVSATGGESGIDFPSVDSGTLAGIAGGLAGAGLLIAAAAFATRRREPGPA
jgi:hypothetical protein